MRTSKKILLTVACVAIVGTGSAFAKGRGNMDHNGMDMGKGMGPKMQLADDGTIVRPTDYIAQVSSVDEKAGTIKVTDLDGKETTIYVNPFTNIRCDDSKDDKTISDIKKGDWIMYSFYNTETEKKLASRILVKSTK